jgi:hypothetical protein
MSMADEQKRELLLLIDDQRKYSRPPYLLQIFCKTMETNFTDFRLDISPIGIFLETMESLFIGQKIEITFNFKLQGKPLKMTVSVACIGIDGWISSFCLKTGTKKNTVRYY